MAAKCSPPTNNTCLYETLVSGLQEPKAFYESNAHYLLGKLPPSRESNFGGGSFLVSDHPAIMLKAASYAITQLDRQYLLEVGRTCVEVEIKTTESCYGYVLAHADDLYPGRALSELIATECLSDRQEPFVYDTTHGVVVSDAFGVLPLYNLYTYLRRNIVTTLDPQV